MANLPGPVVKKRPTTRRFFFFYALYVSPRLETTTHGWLGLVVVDVDADPPVALRMVASYAVYFATLSEECRRLLEIEWHKTAIRSEAVQRPKSLQLLFAGQVYAKTLKRTTTRPR